MPTTTQYLHARLTSIWRSRGALGFAKFILMRIIRSSRDLVFEATIDKDTPRDAKPALGRLLRIDKTNLTDPAVAPIVDQVLSGESEIYRYGLENDDMLFAVVTDDGKVVHYLFSEFNTRTRKLMDEDVSLPIMPANAWTDPSARGKHLYPTCVQAALNDLGDLGYERSACHVEPSNHASIKGLERAGFRKKKSLFSIIILSRLVIQRVESGNDTRWRFFRI